MSGSAYALEGLSPSYYGGAPQMDPQGIFGKILGTIAGPVGGLVAGPAGGIVGGMLGRRLGSAIPFSAPGPQFAPQGAVGDMIGAVGPPLAQHLGGMFGQQQLGQQFGDLLGTVGPMLPFAANPQVAGQFSPELDPMGFNFRRLVQGAQQAVQTAQQAVNAVNTVRQLLPFAAGADGGFGQQQQFAPQGAAGPMLPFQAQPMATLPPELDPMGWGSWLKKAASVAVPIARQTGILPFAAGAGGLDGGLGQQQFSPELDPMGFNLARLVQGAQRAVQTAQQAVNAVNTVRQFLPFAAGVGMDGAAAQQQFAPQGAIGSALGQLGVPLGGALGGLFGQQQLGQQLGNLLGTVGPMLPFQAQPMATLPPELDPLGWGSWLKKAASVAVPIARQTGILPFAADPQAGQFSPELDPLGWGSWLRKAANVAVPIARQTGILPFGAGMDGAAAQQQFAPELDPLGWGSWLKKAASVAVPIARQTGILPFAADPQAAQQQFSPELDPMGFNFRRLVQGAQQAVQTAQQAVNAVNTVRQFLPFAADQQAGQQQLAPQGAVGNLLGQFGAPLGGALGGMLGQQQLGQQLGNLLGTVGPMLPFQAQPMAGNELDPMGFSWGSLVSPTVRPRPPFMSMLPVHSPYGLPF